MPRKFPKLKEGDRRISASEWNNLVEAVETLIGGPDVTRNNGLTRIGNIVGNANRPLNNWRLRQFIPVAIVEEVTEETTKLKVQEIGFKDAPPTSALEFKDEKFDAYPWYNLKAEDYSDFVFTGATPDETTEVLNIQRASRGVWVLQRPIAAPTGIKFAEVKTASATLPVLMVQPIKQDFENDGILVNDGPIISVFVWPKTNGAIYQHHIPPKSVIVIFKIGGEWYADQTVRWYTRANTPVQLVDC